MKSVFFMLILFSMSFASFGQKIISFRTSYYGSNYSYRDFYLGCDSLYLNDYNQNLIANPSAFFDVKGKQIFILVDTQSFELVLNYLMAHNENVDPSDFPQPYAELYYVKVFDAALSESIITNKFGDNKKKANIYFSELIEILERKKASKKLIDELYKMVATLKE